MVQCCAFECKSNGVHRFPKDIKRRKQWEKALRREGFKSTSSSRLCSAHFTKEDFSKEGFYTGLVLERKILRKGTIPTVFAWNNPLPVKPDTKKTIRIQNERKYRNNYNNDVCFELLEPDIVLKEEVVEKDIKVEEESLKNT